MVKAQISVHAWCRHSDVFSHREKWLSPPAPPPNIYYFVFRHHFWCFPFLYIKNTKHNSEKNSSGLSCFCHVSKTFFCSFSCQHLLFFFVAFFPIVLQSLTYWQSIQYFTTEQDWKVTFDLSNQIKAHILYPIREVKWKLTGSKQHNKPMVWRELSDSGCPLTWAAALGNGGLCRFVQLDVNHWEESR